MNFTISELLHSDTASKLGIKNIPTDAQTLDNMFYLIVECLQPIREKIGKPMIITSGYRCLDLNRKLQSKDTSQHARGQAVDFVIKGMSVTDVVKFIRNCGVTFDQLIEEHGKDSTWVHISYVHGLNRKEVLKYANGIYTRI